MIQLLKDGAREVVCPRCGADANWRFLDEGKSVGEIVCPDCGSFDAPREEFDQAESEIVEPADQE